MHFPWESMTKKNYKREAARHLSFAISVQLLLLIVSFISTDGGGMAANRDWPSVYPCS